ncbi:hypothetical protein ACQZWC_004707, partial [Enterobacter bugandensis]
MTMPVCRLSDEDRIVPPEHVFFSVWKNIFRRARQGRSFTFRLLVWLNIIVQFSLPLAAAFTPVIARAHQPCELAFHEAGRYPAGCGFEPVSRDDTRRTAVQGGDARLAAGARTLGGMLSEGHAGDAAAGMARSMASGAANDAV